MFDDEADSPLSRPDSGKGLGGGKSRGRAKAEARDDGEASDATTGGGRGRAAGHAPTAGDQQAAKQVVHAPVTNWRSYPIDVLIRWRDEITNCLPPLALKDLNLEEEMLLQFHVLRALQGDVLNDDELPLNQRTTVANSVASTLRSLADRQEALYTTERYKFIENTLIRELTKLPEEAQVAFLTHYQKVLEGHA